MIKALSNKNIFVIKENRAGKQIVNLTTGQRKDYKKEYGDGQLFYKKHFFSKLNASGSENNILDLSNLYAKLQLSVSPTEISAADKIVQSFKDPYANRRHDLRKLITITIDSETSKDLDDAISVIPMENDAYKCYIHIADVSSYITKKSYIDNKARKRLTSIYYPNTNIPMLPRNLSENALSLLPKVDRLVLTVEMIVKDNVVSNTKIYPSVINSNAKLSYDQVDAFYKGEFSFTAEVEEVLLSAKNAVNLDSAILEDHREYEYEIEDGWVVDISKLEATPSHKLIELLMVHTNVQVGKFLQSNAPHALYRSHKQYDSEKATKALNQVRTLFVLDENVTLDEAKILLKNSNHKKKEVLLEVLERTTPPATYQAHAESHEGLGEEVYLHFTSPIRRYADLVVHRMIHAVLLNETPVYSLKEIKKLSTKINERVASVKKLERNTDDLYLANNLQFLKDKGNYRYENGTIIALVKGGAIVDFGHAKSGFLDLDQFGLGELNEEMTIFTTERRTVELGDKVRVSVSRPNLSRGRVRLRLARGK